VKEKVARLIECERIVRQAQGERLRLIAELNIDEYAARDIAIGVAAVAVQRRVPREVGFPGGDGVS